MLSIVVRLIVVAALLSVMVNIFSITLLYVKVRRRRVSESCSVVVRCIHGPTFDVLN